MLVRPSAHHVRNGATGRIQRFGHILVPLRAVVLTAIVDLHVVNFPVSKSLGILLKVAIRTRRPTAMARLVADTRVKTELQAQRVYVIDDWLHTIGKERREGHE